MERTALPETQKLDVLVMDDSSAPTNRPPTPAIKHIAFLSAFLLPLTVIPYVITRRQVSVLQRKMNEATALTAATFQGDLKRVLVEVARARQETAKVRASLGEVRLDVERLREEVEERQSTSIAADDMLRSDIWKLLEERKYAR